MFKSILITTNQQIFSLRRQIIKNESDGKSGDEKCNNWNEKLPGGAWHKILQTGQKGKKSMNLKTGRWKLYLRTKKED